MSREENGFLTERDKAFLQTDGDYYTGENAKNQRYETREVIAERAREAFHDFAFLYEQLDAAERDRVFDSDESEVLELKEAIQDTIAFLYRSLEGDVDRPISRDRSFQANFNQVFEPGVKQGEEDRQPSGEQLRSQLFSGYGYIDYTPFRIEYKQNPPVPDTDAIIAKLVDQGPNEVSDGELRALIYQAAMGTCMPEPVNDPPEDFERFDLHELADRVAEYDESRRGDVDK
jgi:hypothetical protein